MRRLIAGTLAATILMATPIQAGVAHAGPGDVSCLIFGSTKSINDSIYVNFTDSYWDALVNNDQFLFSSFGMKHTTGVDPQGLTSKFSDQKGIRFQALGQDFVIYKGGLRGVIDHLFTARGLVEITLSYRTTRARGEKITIVNWKFDANPKNRRNNTVDPNRSFCGTEQAGPPAPGQPPVYKKQ